MEDVVSGKKGSVRIRMVASWEVAVAGGSMGDRGGPRYPATWVLVHTFAVCVADIHLSTVMNATICMFMKGNNIVSDRHTVVLAHSSFSFCLG